MVKTRQKNIKVFEFSGANTTEYIDFIKKNFILLKDYLLVFREQIDMNLKEMLEELKIIYIVSENDIKGRENNLSKFTIQKEPTRIYSRSIRSGEEIESVNELIFLNNVNNGARIFSESNISIFGKCEGIVECGGEYLMLRKVVSGYIIFCGEILSTEVIEKINSNDSIKIITKVGDSISIKEIK
ncbi:septum site-determining protein MinC [Helicobacter sp. 13S00477-4]|uniref:septum site-determining protein MinC n=1 Tax=Helicobacter sp. 13S00477-4 TaxID=1905759 RepID=UPI000BA6A80A|nr:septum site-determining protein MinC [Helicobacter sp. 13S00477-4]PAF51588.1 hypothetical protein BKH44_05060 [Helicobacter sp. 13S00477-4]